ncbi:MAG: ISNCY family transposase, partial [Methylococcaceae bacterium]|nr:ISNCY family transposase [Methylococcaceae bacterium]
QCNLGRFKAQYRKIQKLRHSTSKNESKKRAKEAKTCEAHQAYIDLAQFYLNRVGRSVELLKNTYKISEVLLSDLSIFSQHADRQIDQIKRRVIEGE